MSEADRLLKPFAAAGWSQEERDDFWIRLLKQSADGRYHNERGAALKYAAEAVLQRESELLEAFSRIRGLEKQMEAS